jgi:sec-independent protein translocase protein TatA
MANFAEIFGIGTPELIIILLILLLLFGASKLPKLARSFGESAKELKKGLKDEDQKNEKQNDNQSGQGQQ